MRSGKVVSSLLVLALAGACSSGEPASAPSPSVTPAPSVTPKPVKPTLAKPAGDAVPLTRFPILASPCKYLRKVNFIPAMGKQRWVAREQKRTPRSADWAKFTIWPELARAATTGSECLATVNARRALHLKVFAFSTVAEASGQLAPDQNWPGLGDQADLGSVKRGGSGFMRVGRVMVQLVVLYDDLSGDNGKLVVQDVLGDLLPGLPKS